MSQAIDPGVSPVLRDYLRSAGARDELVRLLTGPGGLESAPSIVQLDHRGWQQRQQTLDRLIGSEAITYGEARPERPARPWPGEVLPVIMTSGEWVRLSEGLRQRAELLNAVLADLYGPRRLLHCGIVPSELVLAHSGFLPAADGLSLTGGHQLTTVATNLVRGDDGRWTVLSDRTQAPSGMGYAMANRRLVSRVLDSDYRHMPIRRLRGFFDQLRIALENTLPPDADSPRVAILSSGPVSETAYDQALVAMLVGYPIAQSSDLQIVDGRLWLRTTGRSQPVNIVHRRLDAELADPLDLRSDSLLGVPGLLQAARAHRVSVTNHLGSGILENNGLLAYLDRIAEFLLGEPLKLPTAPTWWCGDPDGQAYVADHLDSLIVKPISRTPGSQAIAGRLLDERERSELLARIAAEPWQWSAQQYLAPSTVPVIESGSLAPHPMVLRTFGVADGTSYSFMPGGLARVASTFDQWNITNSTGAVSKDVWVLESDRPEARSVSPVSLRTTRAARAATAVGLPPSAAENLYWLGRYAERAEMTSRILKVCDQLVADNLDRPATPGHSAMRAMLDALSEVTGAVPQIDTCGVSTRAHDPAPWLRRLLLAETLPGSISFNVARIAGCAANTRELLSGDTFAVLDGLNATLRAARRDEDSTALQPVIDEALRSLLAFAGIAGESLVRDATWAFVEAGRRLERAQLTAQLLRHTVASVGTPISEAVLSESVLSAGDSVITYHRRIAAGVGAVVPAEATLELLLLDPTNPRSVGFQVDRLVRVLASAANPLVDDAAAALDATIGGTDLPQLLDDDRQPARLLLDGLDSGLRELSDLIQRTYFAPALRAFSFAVSERTEDTHGR